MAYSPNPDDSAAPLNTEYASTAASEFRALKTKVNSFFLSSNFNTLENAIYSTKGLALINAGPGTSSLLFGVLANPIRTTGDGSTLGVYISAVHGPSLSTAIGGSVKGILAEVSTDTVASVVRDMVGIDTVCMQRYDVGQSSVIGIRLRFQNRLTVLDEGAVVGGLAADSYNKASCAILIDSQERSTEGEKCGWSTGIKFQDFSLDESITIPSPVAIDFSGIAVTSSALPAVAFNFALATLDDATAAANGGAIVMPTMVKYWIPINVLGAPGHAIPVFDLS